MGDRLVAPMDLEEMELRIYALEVVQDAQSDVIKSLLFAVDALITMNNRRVDQQTYDRIDWLKVTKV